ncbi:hypothetical protein RHMOL_Rhmol05G0030500 [Rhododendron molle]|uniref:Uncharacterized protein n=1 Tax=Rhododendron molle TaxID=49168 RepID=A0ACC0NL60_RHOML|nr:hypothetical protein RHMOL_Rhmol05G0030500 [Rhododendron molle]
MRAHTRGRRFDSPEEQGYRLPRGRHISAKSAPRGRQVDATVVNGMWQTRGGWGRIERDTAVDAMLKYADSGLTTFDMADICKTPTR